MAFIAYVRREVYNSSSTKAKGGTETHYCKILISEVIHHLKVDCDELKMYMVNFKATVIVNKPTKVKCDRKNI